MRRRTMKARRPPEVRWETLYGSWKIQSYQDAMDGKCAIKTEAPYYQYSMYIAVIRCYFSGLKSITFQLHKGGSSNHQALTGIKAYGPDEPFKEQDGYEDGVYTWNATQEYRTFSINANEHWVDIVFHGLANSAGNSADVYISDWEPA